MAKKKITAIMASIAFLMVSNEITGGYANAGTIAQAVELDHSTSPLITKGESLLCEEYTDKINNISDVISSKKSEMVELKNERLREEKELERLAQLERGGSYKIVAGSQQRYQLTAYTMEEEGWEFGGIAADCVTKMYESDLHNRYIAVDRSQIPLGSMVYIEFPEEIRHITYNGRPFDLNGFYKAVDVGGAIRGNIVDLYVGSFGSQYLDLARTIGRRNVTLYRAEEK